MPSISMPSDHRPGDERRARGRFSDGRSAASRVVAVEIEGAHLLIDRLDGSAVIAWPLARLETGEPIIGSTRDVLIHEPGRAGATLFVAEPRFVTAIAEAAPHLTGAAQRWKSAAPFLVVAAFIAAIVAVLAAVDFSPARALASLIPYDTRALLGRQVVRSMAPPGDTCNDPAGMAALQTLTDKLSAAAGPGRKFEVIVSRRQVVNAFAAPGEQIVLMAGLIGQASGPDEVAGVLAHEMGHGIELHPEAGIIRSVGLAVAAELILGGTGGGTIGSIGMGLANLSYSRSAEREADRHALRILHSASISADGIAQFFERMDRRERSIPDGGKSKPKAPDGKPGSDKPGEDASGDIPGFDLIRSHPTNKERLAVIRAAVGTYPATPALDPASWAALRSICGEAAPRIDRPPVKPPASNRPERTRERDI